MPLELDRRKNKEEIREFFEEADGEIIMERRQCETRTFDSGATRDTDEGKLDFEGFLSPTVLERYAKYMHFNRVQSDGSLRDSDNWQKGIPNDQYMKSLWRHFFASWKHHRQRGTMDSSIEDDLCGVIFNAMGYLHEVLKKDTK